MSEKIVDLFTIPTQRRDIDWKSVVRNRQCVYVNRTCVKTRKSDPGVAIGTCTVQHGRSPADIIICPHRFLERKQIFIDCIHLLTLHEPGNVLHVVPEVSVPGGNVDYFLISVKGGKVADFVGIELQAVDSTGTVWPARQRFLKSVGVEVNEADVQNTSPYGMNWKMTAKTTLVQLHHKVRTFEHVNKHFVLVLQDSLLAYMAKEFSFDHIGEARLGDLMHFHAYTFIQDEGQNRIELTARTSTDSEGIAICLGLQASPNVELSEIIATLQSKLSERNRLTI
jgi:Restriction endonuclease NotI